MSNKFSRTPAPLAVDITPSRWLRGIHLLACVLAIIALTQCDTSPFVRVAAGGATLLYFLCCRRQSIPIQLRYDAGWSWCSIDGSALSLELVQATVWPPLLVLRFRDPQRSRFNPFAHRCVALLPDSVGADDWRRLRIHLQHFAVYGAVAEASM